MDAEFVRFFEREKGVWKFARSLSFAQVCDAQARIAALTFHAGCRERDASRYFAPLLVRPCLDLPAENAARQMPFLKKACNCVADIFLAQQAIPVGFPAPCTPPLAAHRPS